MGAVGGDDRADLHPQENKTISCYTEYTYMGTKIDYGGGTEKEIEDRIIKVKTVIGCLNSILWSKCISREKMHLLYHSIFNSIVVYGCEI